MIGDVPACLSQAGTCYINRICQAGKKAADDITISQTVSYRLDK